MNKIYCIVASIILLGCQKQEKKLLASARAKLDSSSSITYQQTIAGIGGMSGDFEGISTFRKNPEAHVGWDLVGKNSLGDVAYIEDDLKLIDHNNKKIYTYPEEYVEKIIKTNIVYQNSPIQYLKNQDWIFSQDTTMEGLTYQEFRRKEIDTFIVEDNDRLIVNNHIFINTETELIDRFERRHFKNGNQLPKVINVFRNYKLKNKKESLYYQIPDGYSNILFGEKRMSKTIGELAPSFETVSLTGDSFSLEKYKGSKVLLNFSFINCGSCKLALRHFRRENYNLSEKINAFYLNPIDKEEDIKLYAQKKQVPYAILKAPNKIEELYGISGYPTFILIDEEGKIESISSGYSSDFLASLEAK